MDSVQYEELCRNCISRQTGVPIENVRSVVIPNPTRPGLLEYRHQVDLYWETGDAAAQYLNIADAKWRGTAKVDQGDVLLLQKVREKVAAHKAFMITNVGFTAGAIGVADDHGIALHILVPRFDASILPRGDRVSIQAALQAHAASATEPIYSLHVEHRGLGFLQLPGAVGESPQPMQTAPRGYATRVIQPPSRALPGPPANRSVGSAGTAGRGALNPGFGPPGAGFVKK